VPEERGGGRGRGRESKDERGRKGRRGEERSCLKLLRVTILDWTEIVVLSRFIVWCQVPDG
jgi:hypothetical protein